MTFPPDAREIQFREIVLERLKVASRQYLSPALQHEQRADVIVDDVTGRLVMQLSTYVLADRLLRDAPEATFSREVEVRQPAARLLWPIMAVAVAATFLGLAVGSLAVLAVAAATALAYVVALAANPPNIERRTVSGTVTIPVTSYVTFPENTTVYPDSLGQQVRFQQIESPSWWFDEDGER